MLPAQAAIAVRPFEPLPAVADARLAAMRGGFTQNGLDMFFGITREVLVNGQVIATTQLVIGNLDRLAAGGLPSVQTIGNALLLVQSGAGNVAPGVTIPATSAITSLAAPGSAPAAQSVANAGPASMAAASAPSAPQGAQTPTPAATAPQMGTPSLAPATANTPSASTPAPAAAAPAMTASSPPPNPSLPPAAALASGGAPVTVTPLSVAGQIILLPNAAAIVTAVQNSVDGQLLQTRTQIDATLNALSAMRSGAFAAALQAQTQAGIRP
jgi:cell division septation protein DedD